MVRIAKVPPSDVRRITSIAFAWIAPNSAFGSMVRKQRYRPRRSLTFRIDFHRVHSPAKQAEGRDTSNPNQTGAPASVGAIFGFGEYDSQDNFADMENTSP
jgi:hypothetical protein